MLRAEFPAHDVTKAIIHVDRQVEVKLKVEKPILTTTSISVAHSHRAKDADLGVRKPAEIISRHMKVTATCDVRGNLGPCGVVVQNPPGSDWLKDRWQAASDMGGTAIPGRHFVILEFEHKVLAEKVRLDWETAYAEAYRLEARIDDSGPWIILFDGTVGVVGPSPVAGQRLATPGRVTSTAGQSPGVPKGVVMPLHVVHDIELDEDAQAVPFRFMRLFVEKPAIGWGVSLWQFDVFGRVAS